MASSSVAAKTPIQKVKPAANLSQKKREFVAPPTHPGKVLLLQFMNPLGLTVEVLAARTGHSISYIEALTRQQERVSEAFALVLSREFGTGPEVWLNLQQFTDDFVAKRVIDDYSVNVYNKDGFATRDQLAPTGRQIMRSLQDFGNAFVRTLGLTKRPQNFV